MKEFFYVCFADSIFNLNAITIIRMLTRHMADNHYSLANIDKCSQMHFYAKSLTNWNWMLLVQIFTFQHPPVKWYGIGIWYPTLLSVRKCLHWFEWAKRISGGSINQHSTDGICITLLLMASVFIHWPSPSHT